MNQEQLNKIIVTLQYFEFVWGKIVPKALHLPGLLKNISVFWFIMYPRSANDHPVVSNIAKMLFSTEVTVICFTFPLTDHV